MATARTFTSGVFWLAVLAALAWALFRIFEPFLAPVLWALLLAFMLFPINRWLRQRLHGRNGAAALLLTLAVVVGIVVPTALLAFAFLRQGSELLTKVSAAAEQYKIARPSDILNLPIVNRPLHWIQEKMPVTTDQLQQRLGDGVAHLQQFLVASGRALLVGALSLLVNLALTLFLLFFFFRDGDAFGARLLRVIPAADRRKQLLIDHLSSVTKAVVMGSLLTGLAQGALIAVAFWIVGLPSPVVFGFVAAVLALLPIGGTAFVWIPGAIALGVGGHWGGCVFLTVWGALVVGSADNFLRPLLISGRAQISTLPVFFGVLGGLAAFGMIGMFLGPLVIAMALALLGFAEESRESGIEKQGTS